MSDQNNTTTTRPGKSLSIRAGTPPDDDAQINLTSHTTIADFDQIEHLLSEKPLRKPNRQDFIDLP